MKVYKALSQRDGYRGNGIGAGVYSGPDEAFIGLEPVKTIEPNKKLASSYKQAY